MPVRLIRRGRAAQQLGLFADRVARDVDVEFHERARPHALRLRQHREIGHADVEHEEATRTEQAVRGSPCGRRSSSMNRCDTEQQAMTIASNGSPVPGQSRMSPRTSDTRSRYGRFRGLDEQRPHQLDAIGLHKPGEDDTDRQLSEAPTPLEGAGASRLSNRGRFPLGTPRPVVRFLRTISRKSPSRAACKTARPAARNRCGRR